MSAFVLDENQAMLADSARKYAARGYGDAVRSASLAHAHGCDSDRWGEFAELGWLGLPLPEAHGGLGGTPADMCVLAEELGRALVVEPWLSSAVLGGGLLADAGDRVQCDTWLPALAAGEKRIAFAAWEPGSRFDATRVDARAEPFAGGFKLHGAKELAIGAPGADALIVAACVPDRRGLALFVVPGDARGLEARAYALQDGRRAAQLRFDGVEVAASARLAGDIGAASAIELALDRAMVVQCAETIGVMQRAFEITLDYVKTRKQFGRVLAANQVLQHRLVDLYVSVEEGRALVRAAAHAFSGSREQRRSHAAAAKAYVAQAARTAWEESVQLHGAIGMTDEYVIGRYVKHLATSHTLFGDVDFHLERLARSDLDPAS